MDQFSPSRLHAFCSWLFSNSHINVLGTWGTTEHAQSALGVWRVKGEGQLLLLISFCIPWMSPKCGETAILSGVALFQSKQAPEFTTSTQENDNNKAKNVQSCAFLNTLSNHNSYYHTQDEKMDFLIGEMKAWVSVSPRATLSINNVCL